MNAVALFFLFFLAIISDNIIGCDDITTAAGCNPMNVIDTWRLLVRPGWEDPGGFIDADAQTDSCPL